MLQLTGEGRFADAMERALYNGAVVGVSLDGAKFFYENPLESRGEAHRQPWFDCACCPPNIARLLASLGQYTYSQSESEAAVHLYVQGRAVLELGGREVVVEQKTEYPWRDRVQLRIGCEEAARFTLALRIPGWCRGARAKLNGRPLRLEPLTRNGYARVKRLWQPGDEVVLTLPMPVERIEANPAVVASAGRVALQRGPVVFCLEAVDNGENLNDILLPRGAKLAARLDRKLLGGVVAITGSARRIDRAEWRGALYRPAGSRTRATRIKAVPYCVWDNRKAGEMLVWIRES